MSKRVILAIILGVFLLLGLIYFASKTKTMTVFLPSELVGQQNLSRIRVAGRVVENSIEYKTDPLLLLFKIKDPGSDLDHVLQISYSGLKPDMFAAERDVIIDGNLENGVLVAASLLTQCPSKYEAPKPGNTPMS